MKALYVLVGAVPALIVSLFAMPLAMIGIAGLVWPAKMGMTVTEALRSLALGVSAIGGFSAGLMVIFNCGVESSRSRLALAAAITAGAGALSVACILFPELNRLFAGGPLLVAGLLLWHLATYRPGHPPDMGTRPTPRLRGG